MGGARLTSALALGLLAGAALLGPAPASCFDLADLRWQGRPLLLFAPSAEDPRVRTFRAQLDAAEPELRERDMVRIEVFGADLASLDGGALPEGTAADLRRRYQVPAETAMLILVGKDGGEKLRAADRWDLDAVFALIDRMPMRRQEQRERAVPHSPD